MPSSLLTPTVARLTQLLQVGRWRLLSSQPAPAMGSAYAAAIHCAASMSGIAHGSSVGWWTVGTVSKTGSGGAINISTSGAFGANVTFGTLESTSSPGANLNLTSVTGTLGVTSAGAGFSGSAASSPAINVNGGSVSFTYGGNVTKSNAGALLSVSGGHTGTLTFNTGT